MINRVGEILGNYRLTQLLGKGGFAEVYLGEHLHIRKQAAIKVLQTHIDESSVASFQREAQIIAELQHPSIISVFDFALQDDVPFLIMQYCAEGSLRKRHPRGTRVSLETVVKYVEQIAEALQYAHEKRLIHRDVKPENMLIGPQGEILLSDFGIATIAHSTSSMSMPTFAGTPYYMAPEQIREQPKPASDQYALATVVYEWLTGTTPFKGTASEIFAKQLLIEPASLREQTPELTQEIDQVVHKALEKDPFQRFASTRAFAIALAAAALSPHTIQQSAQQLSIVDTQIGQPSSFPQLFNGAAKSAREEEASKKQKAGTLASPLITAMLPESTQMELPISTPGEQAIPQPTKKESTPARSKFADITKASTNQFYPEKSKRSRTQKGLLTVLASFVALVFIGALVLFATRATTQMPKSSQVQAAITVPASTSTSLPAISTIATTTATHPPDMTPTTSATPIVRNTITATPTAGGALAYPGYLPGHGQLAVYDPITPKSNWEQGPNNDKSGYCEFSGAAYHATMNKSGYRWCYERLGRSFSNFVYQIKITIVQGDCAGVFFRYNSSGITYAFVVCQTGEENLYVEGVTPDGRLHLIESNSSGTGIKTGLNQANLIAVAAQGSTISMFVNKQQVAQVQDSSSSEGNLGVAAVDQSQETNAIFSNATIWTL